MAKLINRTIKNPAASFLGGTITASVTKTGLTIYSPAMNRKPREVLQDYFEAMKLLTGHIAKSLGKPIGTRGRRIDPDEPTQEGDYTVSYRVFPKDTTRNITFTRYSETGKVLADVPACVFTDAPSYVQYADVCRQAADLMRSYERV